ncbi:MULTISPECIES: cob(I)yrinic acid a,c-diamide adenosyltransferase [Thermoanaerobacterium]|uniref:ATP:corrinoid adenosyltransferase BtuR/CobO/CobP n=1 Tax=Thermoanaerobacterium xylanolyticum (strain ATCC 49914 / DSM 7097 / LX-11) TaxID=858215 RepID=F6BI15_THEXL|nr:MULTISPECIES: cob(I)yrinic acid a,c-diamide adenosyltransferase [Thermoanaerobacterium]AEF17689.1 ATP:corrinoid adenosyltransferase BtuR/CobO/CobP [Thermoanaerobacterium xylanolyticum LX-11]MDE4541440.1 cob(I)yrinic acid a,c-diamide adenosyltransferase [Thermoanaerobacterium sp. R66]ORX23033.1 cob(I)yrinic acid a,c-diamide adenosyltransferase [Thermoanaerobacterium sp. PSU-2]HHV73155.1 cob(I)yrinic acid a,c-diamide adenosyltransferase [Thermoanaerobacterium sp.]
MKNGLIQIYTGDGKGKTTAAIGLGIRALGRDFKVYMVQFLKGRDTGELYVLKNIDNFKVFRFQSSEKFFFQMDENEKNVLRDEMHEAYKFIENVIKNEECDMLILDEIMGVIQNNIFSVEDVLKLMKEKPDTMEMILTGRNAPKELIDNADLVTEMKLVKHPFEKGISARYGIEF